MDLETVGQPLTDLIDPGPEVEEFANALDNCLAPGLSLSEKRARILDLPRKYHENAIRRLAHKQPKRPRDSADDMDMDADEQLHDNGQAHRSEELKQLEEEVETWDLFRRLLPLRYPGRNAEPMRFSSPFSASRSANLDHVNEFLESDNLALERRAVLQWLQTNAAAGPDIDELAQELQQNADRGDIIAHGWLHTRSKIKLRKSITAWPHLLDRQSPNVLASHLNSEGGPLVMHLDPDATSRQGRKLEPQDEYFERAIWLGCFEHLRRGSSSEDIREWCKERTEMWRAVSMSAMPLSVDDQRGTVSNTEPSVLILWRRMCYALARQGGSNDYERAVYGVLSGDIGTVEKVAKSWDDYLFAHYNALLRTQIDAFLMSKCPPEMVTSLTQPFSAFDAVQFYGDDRDIEKRLIQGLESRKNIEKEAKMPSKALQASFIAKDLDRHLHEQGLVMARSANEVSKSCLIVSGLDSGSIVASQKYFDLANHRGLRIVSHVFVLLALLRRFEEQESGFLLHEIPADWRFSQENILAAYTDFLRRCKLQELIPLYCSVLDAPRCYEVLSWNVIEEPEPNSRITQLKLIKRAGIDVLTFVETQAALFFDELDRNPESFAAKKVFSILEDGPPTSRHGRIIKPDFFGEEEDVVAATDVRMIRALEWLLIADETWPKVFSVGTKVYKYFLGNHRLTAARRLMHNVTFAAVMRDMTDQDEADIALYDNVDFWAQQLEQSGIHDVQPEQVMADARDYRELEALVKALDGLETIASLVLISADPVTATKDFWNRVGAETKKVKANMQSLLQNWLLTGIEGGDEELRQLRQTYLPETIIAYVSALHFAGTGLSRDHLLECMELASVVAERNSDIAATFVKAGRMAELVDAFTACSKALAITTGEKRPSGSGNKKLREMGWSRDLWAVKQNAGTRGT